MKKLQTSSSLGTLPLEIVRKSGLFLRQTFSPVLKEIRSVRKSNQLSHIEISLKIVLEQFLKRRVK